MTAVSAALRQLCPRCRKGRIFRGSLIRTWLSTNERCPVCDLKFEREQGYFIGSMYVSYLLSIPPAVLLVMFFWMVAGWQFEWACVGAVCAYLPLVPLVTRVARVLWIHIDHAVDPQ
jgi:uncharacterized protein (DUF983 family)